MDGSNNDHSDSDSGESWTLLENSPLNGDDTDNYEHQPPNERVPVDAINEKDEDTDGISIISDSEPESTPCEISYERCVFEENRPTEHDTQFILANPLPSNNHPHHESIRGDDDFLGENTGKLKTYVHRRNKRLSTVLNIIMLGSVITAAGVAIGHMWGARNDCTMQTTPSVNKILSNLYKLQEENAYLRNKIKEVTATNMNLMQHHKPVFEKQQVKPQRCKKMFEEPLDNKNTHRVVKCIDNENTEYILGNPTKQPEYEKEFLKDINKLKNVYQQNKSWLDEEISKRLKHEEGSLKSNRDVIIEVDEEQTSFKDENLKKQIESDPPGYPNESYLEGKPVSNKVSYADSLKTDQIKKIQKKEINNINKNNLYSKGDKAYAAKKKNKTNDDIQSQISYSEEDFKKDNRYITPKTKKDRKKYDRQKMHKKQKRKNKYEQWEMKGGYLKDYDEFSVASSQENDYLLKKDKSMLSRDFERNNYINQFSELKSNIKSETVDSKTLPEKYSTKHEETKKHDTKELKWYEKRAALRNEARKKLEYELFGESSPNNAGWYFRRMQRREQCRALGDNSTYRKMSKRKMNFKMKH